VSLVLVVRTRNAPGPAVVPVAPAAWAPVRRLGNRPLRVMPLGDSITYGVGSTDRGGYRTILAARLDRSGLRVDFVGSQRSGPRGRDDDNEGHAGWTIARIGARVGGWMRRYQPDVVLLHIGTNDVWRPARAPGAAQRLSKLIDRIRRSRPRAEIFVALVVGSPDPGIQSRIDRYNAAVRTVVRHKGARVHLVDQRGVRAGDLRDRLHPNNAGYTKMAAVWFRAIRAVSPAPSG
jgi:lysophospholipase L1-like esterase